MQERKAEYVQSERKRKTAISKELVSQWRSQNPPGRFLLQDEESDFWNDIGDRKARRKTAVGRYAWHNLLFLLIFLFI